LDTILNDRPVQHREVQGHESDLFMSHFPKGIRVLDGGYESTKWHHVSEDDSPGKVHLLHVRGNGRHVTAKEVPASGSELNSGDVFIVDDEKKHLIIWFGGSSSPFEKSKASEIAETIETERASKIRTITLDEHQSGPDVDTFWSLLGGKVTPKPATDAYKTRALPFAEKKLLKMHIDLANDTADLKQIATGADCKRSLLTSTDIFLFDSGSHIYIWVGKSAGTAGKLQAYYHAEKYLASQPERGLIPITTTSENHPAEEFLKVIPA